MHTTRVNPEIGRREFTTTDRSFPDRSATVRALDGGEVIVFTTTDRGQGLGVLLSPEDADALCSFLLSRVPTR